ncbi:MAG: xylulose kinase, partial [Actinobacteria bacterium]|nr:xylulose kinase [Actinomycetota bacterium]
SAFGLAWEQASTQVGSGEISAISIGGQQHGMVALDARDQPLHPAKLWNDTESAPDADWLKGQLSSGHEDGAVKWADAVGSVPVAAFTVTKLSWLHRTHSDLWADLAHVLLPHDYLTHRLTGGYTTDRGDASGTGYWSPTTGEYRWDILALIDSDRDWSQVVPTVLGPLDIAGTWEGVMVAPGTGDNMAAALGVGLRPGDAVISVGTSGTAYSVSDVPTADATGAVAGFADATGRYLPLVCTSNAAKVFDAFARLLGVDHEELDRLALRVKTPGDDQPAGPTLLPYFDGERTPNRPDAAGLLAGLRSDISREQFARAAVDGVACGLLDAFDALNALAPVTGKLLLTGGGARSRALQGVLNGLVDVPVALADADEAVATGAAVQAAAVLEQAEYASVQDRWGLGAGSSVDFTVDCGDLRERYAALRDEHV